MSQIKCECGNTFFQQIRPEEYDEDNFVLWGKESLKPLNTTVAAIKCLQCGKIILAATSLSGKNQLDPTVQAYARLLENLPKINGIPGEPVKLEPVIGVVDFVHKSAFEEAISDLASTMEKALKEIRELKEARNKEKETVKADVKTGNRGGKGSK